MDHWGWVGSRVRPGRAGGSLGDGEKGSARGALNDLSEAEIFDGADSPAGPSSRRAADITRYVKGVAPEPRVAEGHGG